MSDDLRLVDANYNEVTIQCSRKDIYIDWRLDQEAVIRIQDDGGEYLRIIIEKPQ